MAASKIGGGVEYHQKSMSNICSKAEILETTFSFRKFRPVPCRFRVPLMSFYHVVWNRSQNRKYPLLNSVVSFRVFS